MTAPGGATSLSPEVATRHEEVACHTGEQWPAGEAAVDDAATSYGCVSLLAVCGASSLRAEPAGENAKDQHHSPGSHVLALFLPLWLLLVEAVVAAKNAPTPTILDIGISRLEPPTVPFFFGSETRASSRCRGG